MSRLMLASPFNQITKLSDGNYALFNLLSGAFDLVDEAECSAWLSGIPRNDTEKKAWLSRGYFFSDDSALQAYQDERYQDFLQAMLENQTQFMLVLSYSCNFSCPYCYQKGINSKELMTPAMLDAFFQFVVDFRTREKKDVIISLFGGEPLIKSPAHEVLLNRLAERLIEHQLPLSVVTNGFQLEHYLPLLGKAQVREIHVTFDGDKEHHDRRRVTKAGEKSFDQIIRGITMALSLDMPVNVRIIVDKKNIASLSDLAQVFESLGWLDLPKESFKVALGRNYELIDDYILPDDLFTLDGMIFAYVGLMTQYPVLQKMYLPDFFGITKMVNSGEMYTPSFDTCPAVKSEYVCDASGQIYGCTASCGRDGYAVGSFYPTLSWDQTALAKWQSRSILTISQCKDCSVAVVCGGGCGVIAKDEKGEVLAPNCKPIKAVMDIGIRYYEAELKEMAGVSK